MRTKLLCRAVPVPPPVGRVVIYSHDACMWRSSLALRGEMHEDRSARMHSRPPFSHQAKYPGAAKSGAAAFLAGADLEGGVGGQIRGSGDGSPPVWSRGEAPAGGLGTLFLQKL